MTLKDGKRCQNRAKGKGLCGPHSKATGFGDAIFNKLIVVGKGAAGIESVLILLEKLYHLAQTVGPPALDFLRNVSADPSDFIPHPDGTLEVKMRQEKPAKVKETTRIAKIVALAERAKRMQAKGDYSGEEQLYKAARQLVKETLDDLLLAPGGSRL
jgi:hypothetical protein